MFDDLAGPGYAPMGWWKEREKKRGERIEKHAVVASTGSLFIIPPSSPQLPDEGGAVMQEIQKEEQEEEGEMHQGELGLSGQPVMH